MTEDDLYRSLSDPTASNPTIGEHGVPATHTEAIETTDNDRSALLLGPVTAWDAVPDLSTGVSRISEDLDDGAE